MRLPLELRRRRLRRRSPEQPRGPRPRPLPASAIPQRRRPRLLDAWGRARSGSQRRARGGDECRMTTSAWTRRVRALAGRSLLLAPSHCPLCARAGGGCCPCPPDKRRWCRRHFLRSRCAARWRRLGRRRRAPGGLAARSCGCAAAVRRAPCCFCTLPPCGGARAARAAARRCDEADEAGRLEAGRLETQGWRP